MKKERILGALATMTLAAAVLFAGGNPVKAEENPAAGEDIHILEGVYIGNVNVSGMNEQQARSAVEVYVNGLLSTTFTLSGENGSIEMTAEDMGVSADAEEAVATALNAGRAGSLINRYKVTEDLKKEPLVLDMNLSVDKQATAQKLYKNSGKLSIEAVDNSLVREDGEFRFVPGKEGIEVDIVESVYAINDFLASGWDGTDNEITLVSAVVEPRGSREELEQVKDLLGGFSTNFSSSSAGRAKNVTTGTSKINGTILYPGEEFELRPTVSPFTQENGYELAGAYQNGTTVESFGGGICQVATTLYNAAIRAELDITMRFNHSMQVSYVKPSMDAAIAGDYKDLHFKNNYDTPIYIEGYCSGGILYFNIFGKETRPSNREISFVSETLTVADPELEFNLDSSQPLGYWNVEQSAHVGCTAQLWKVVTVDGQEESRELFNKSSYQSSPKIITIGTNGLSGEQLAALKAAADSGDEGTVKAAISAIKKEIADKDKEDKEDDDKKDDDKKDDKTDDDKKDDKKPDETDDKPDPDEGNGGEDGEDSDSGE
ncbi:MAG: VanW family protein [Muribaculaceae bacterium]|nr:VanW family protein [Roseburia sp.]MCM1431622.1 VanW family protein [Muribaculaceae bacterium]MCM1492087.1 VanW family protein [Muribaculaceae bacterium]